MHVGFGQNQTKIKHFKGDLGALCD